jgi:hypothetical protein
MRWKPFIEPDGQPPHPIHWLWLWPLAAFAIVIIALLVTLEWIEKHKRRLIGPSEEWRPWFAWHFVRVNNVNKTVWLERIERREKHGWREYRIPEGDHQ